MHTEQHNAQNTYPTWTPEAVPLSSSRMSISNAELFLLFGDILLVCRAAPTPAAAEPPPSSTELNPEIPPDAHTTNTETHEKLRIFGQLRVG